MKINNHVILAVFFVFSLASCSTMPLIGNSAETDENEIDIVELERTADLAYQQNDLVESERQYAELARRMPELALHWFRLGNVFARTQRPDAAINAYREAVLRDPKYTRAWYNMSIVQIRQAANSLNEMQTYAEAEDPLYEQGKKLLDDVLKIIKQD